MAATAYACYPCWLNRGYVLRLFFDRAGGWWGRAALGEVVIDGPPFEYHANDLHLVGGQTPWTRLAHRCRLDVLATRDYVARTLTAAGFVVEPVRDGVPDHERDHVVARRVGTPVPGGKESP